MRGVKQLAVGVVCGVALAAAAGMLLGSGNPNDPLVFAGITGYSENGVHYSVAWEGRGSVLHPVAQGAIFTSDLSLSQTVQANIAILAPTPDSQNDLANTVMSAIGATSQAERDRFYQKAAGIVLTGTNCPQCDAEYRSCKGTPAECFGHLVLCKTLNCH